MIATKKNKKKNFAGRKFKDEIISWIANENSKNKANNDTLLQKATTTTNIQQSHANSVW